ncbi:heat shock 70 kDa protein 15-like [Triticum dicoccoides]|uniref:heat shock 70 kDa protein 15-like n=1 Tax=Triticum dicoccoides TaxID=85692 RepID=UPI00188E3072|nr:heat shock 70 kDa protein 15-like [Triticum dicoccoides]
MLEQREYDFATLKDKHTLLEVQVWLHGDGMNATKGTYMAKLEELKRFGASMDACYREREEICPTLEQLVYRIRSFREAALSSDPKFNHNDISDKQQVLGECSAVQNWLVALLNPALLVSDLRKKAEALDQFCKPIMANPTLAPEPQTPPLSETAESKGQTPEEHHGGATEASKPASEGGAQELPAAEQMGTEKPDCSPNTSLACAYCCSKEVLYPSVTGFLCVGTW